MADWFVWCPGQGEKRATATTYARATPEAAAVAWAADDDAHGSHEIAFGLRQPEVMVASADRSADPVLLMVTGEAPGHYEARLVTPGDADVADELIAARDKLRLIAIAQEKAEGEPVEGSKRLEKLRWCYTTLSVIAGHLLLMSDEARSS